MLRESGWLGRVGVRAGPQAGVLKNSVMVVIVCSPVAARSKASWTSRTRSGSMVIVATSRPSIVSRSLR